MQKRVVHLKNDVNFDRTFKKKVITALAHMDAYCHALSYANQFQIVQ